MNESAPTHVKHVKECDGDDGRRRDALRCELRARADPSCAVRAPIGLLAELTHRCPLAVPLLLQSARAREGQHRADDGRVAEGHARGRRSSAFCRCICRAASRRRAATSKRSSRPRPRVGLYTNLITAAVLLKRDRLEKLKECGLDHVQISIQDVDTRPRTPTASAATRAAAPRRRKWPAGCASSACR